MFTVSLFVKYNYVFNGGNMTKDIKGINEVFLQYCFNHYNCKTISELSRATGWALETISRVRNGKRDVPFKWELDSGHLVIEVLCGNTIKTARIFMESGQLV